MRPVSLTTILSAAAVLVLAVTGALSTDASEGVGSSGSGSLNRVDPQVATLTASKDNTLHESATGDKSNGQGAYFFVGNTNERVIRRAVLAFDIAAAIPADAEVDSVTLSLSMSKTSSGSQEVGLHVLTQAWGEGASNARGNEGSGAQAENGDATWLHTYYPDQMWSTPGGDFVETASASISVAGPGKYEWSSEGMQDDVEAWLADPDSNHGWILIGTESDAGGQKLRRTSKRFDSRDNLDSDARPQLTIEYRVEDSTSEPSTGTPATQTATATSGTATPETATPETQTPATGTPSAPTPSATSIGPIKWSIFLPLAKNER